MTFLRIMFVKEHPYLYRQTNVRYGKQLKSYCTYLGPVAGGVPWGVRERPRKPRRFGETRTPRVDVTDPRECEAIEEQITLGTAIAAERLEREKRRRGKDSGKWERSMKRLEGEIRTLRMLAEQFRLWHRL
jgi:hypothetical protein